MIPILYEKDETEFASNGLGRLRSMISAVVVEERNGVYELDFEYPITADDFSDIQLGRIIGVTHDDSDDIQPFDIVSYEKPIDGIVKFHCTHISYRQSYLTVSGKNINSLADAFARLKNYATPTNPFTYETDKTSTGYLASITGVPKSVRSILGGIEGSILDAYGGEYEWDKFRVILHANRGTDRDFTIRYGVNMVDFNEELSTEGTYSACIPYWTDGTKVVKGSKVTWGDTITGRGECVPLDVSDKFESKPTAAQVEATALSLMKRQNTAVPVQNLHVEFIRLQDMPEYAGFGNLLKCGLCDTIKVIFPFSPSAATFKIVKTTWDVLGDRYESMELGDLSMSLSEALGVSENSNSIISPAWAESVDAKLQNIGDVKRVYLDADKSVPNSTGTELCSINLEAGTWIVTCGVRWATNITGYRRCNFGVNSGATTVQMQVAPVTGSYTQTIMTRIVTVEGGTYYLNGYQNSGGALVAKEGSENGGTFITAIRIT